MKQGFKFFVSAFLLCVCLSSASLMAASSSENTAPAEKSTGTTQPLPLSIHIMQLLHLTSSEVGSGSSCIKYDAIMTLYPSICDDANSYGDCSSSQTCSIICSDLTTYCTGGSGSSYPNCPPNYSSFCEKHCNDVIKYKSKCPAFCGCAKTKCCTSMQSTKAGS